MKIALIDPTFRHEGKLLKLNRVGYFPLTLPRLAACFPPEVSLTLFYEKCTEVDTGGDFDLVFFTTMGSSIARAEELSAIFRRRGIKTVVGGYSVPPFLDRCLEHFDAAVIGDGEGVIPRILDDFRMNSLRRVYENLAPSLAHLPEPRWDLVPPEVLGNVVPIEASRGCPNGCTFCAVSFQYHSSFRKRPVEDVVREIRSARKQLGRHLYYFTDPNFTADLGFAKALLRAIRELKIHWLASVDIRCLVDSEFLALARESGCYGLQVGFETLSESELENVNKRFAAKFDYSEIIRRAQDQGIPLVALMMVGFDSDDLSTFTRIRAFLEKNHLPMAVIHPMIPIPGTPFFKRLEAEDRLLENDPKLCDGLHVFFRPKHFSPEELLERFWALNRRIFSLRSIVRRFFHKSFFQNPLAYFILLITNLFHARKLVYQRLPLGLYE